MVVHAKVVEYLAMLDVSFKNIFQDSLALVFSY